MSISAGDAVATLRYLIPGFVALTVFYWFGVRVKRPDWLWLVWALVVTVPIAMVASAIASGFGATNTNLAATIAECGVDAVATISSAAQLAEPLEECVTSALAKHNAGLELLIGVVLGALLGALAIPFWRLLAKIWPPLRAAAEPTAWGMALAQGSRWLEVKTSGGEIYSGYNAQVALPAETEDLDLYLGKPALRKDGDPPTWEVLDGIEGVLLSRSEMKWVRVVAPPE